jgi:hypothetical protein
MRSRATRGSHRRTEADRADVIVECHALAELAAHEGLARDRERDLACAGIAEAAGPERDVVATRDTVDVALVDDASVRVEEVERGGRAAPVEVARPVDDCGASTGWMPEQVKRLEQTPGKPPDVVVDRFDADEVDEAEPDLDCWQIRRLTVPSSKGAAPGADLCHSRCTKAARTVPPENQGQGGPASARASARRAPANSASSST